jgi:membrane fusion protein (multidrug efflux system)
MKVKNFLIPFLIIIASIIISISLFSLRSDPPKKPASPKEKIVNISVVKLEEISSSLNGLGKLTSAQPLVLFSEVSGIVQRGNISFRPAQFFRKGDLIVKIDDRQIKLDINSAKSDFLNALSSVLPEIKVDFPNEFRVWQDYFDKCDVYSPLPQLPEAQNQKIKLFLSRFNVYKLYFTVRNLEVRLEKYFFYAPFIGSILTADLAIGSTARNGSRLGEVINLEDMEVEIPVQVADVEWIDSRSPVTLVSSELNKEWQGKIVRIGSFIDPKTQSVSVFVRPEYSALKQLYEGIFLKAHMPGKKIKNAFSIPRKALYQEGYVYCIKKGRLDYRTVGIARRETNSVIIIEGIATGDTIVTEVLQGVATGMIARPKISQKREGK